MDPKTHHPFTRTMLATIGVIVGIGSGSFGMWLTISDRADKERRDFEDRIKLQVRREMQVDNRITRLEERYEALKTTVWSKQQAAESQ